jgi:hypothetical protein
MPLSGLAHRMAAFLFVNHFNFTGNPVPYDHGVKQILKHGPAGRL